MCQQAGLLFGWVYPNKRCIVARANCDSWSCAECSRRMGESWGFRAYLGCNQILKRGQILDFVTITSHERLETFTETERVWRSAWAKLYAALKRKQSALEYMIVPEKHKDGRMHVHCLWNAGVTKKWLKDNARSRGLGYQCEVIHITGGGRAQQYVTKYVGKDLGSDMPPKFRRVRVSNHWPDIPKPSTSDSGLQWEYVGTNGALQVMYDECAAKHITLIDKETGEHFDDVDLGTIVAS